MTPTQTVQRLLRDGFILVFDQDRLDVVQTASALQEAGFGNMEVTCRIRQPLAKLQQVRKALPDFAVGAASLIDDLSVLDAYNCSHKNDPLPTVKQVVDAGADYVVSAGNFRAETFQRHAGEVAMIPGCGTVTEILTQFGWGANLVKVFPAKQLGGPAFIKAVDAPTHRMIPLVPTGGTDAANIPDYVAAGVLVLGGSFSAIDRAALARIIDQQDYGLLAAELKAVRALVNQVRAKQWPTLDFAGATVDAVSLATGRQFNLTR